MKGMKLVLVLGFGFVVSARAQQFKAGDKVAASYTSSEAGWQNGCTFVSGPHTENNGYYLVSCGGRTYWVGPKWVRADGTAPAKAATVAPAHAAAPVRTSGSTAAAASARAAAPAEANATRLKPGKYSCYAGNPEHYTFLDVNIRSATTYTDVDGKSGNYSFDPATQRVTFSSGSFEGTYAKLLPNDTIGMASKPNSFFATTCQLTK